MFRTHCQSVMFSARTWLIIKLYHHNTIALYGVKYVSGLLTFQNYIFIYWIYEQLIKLYLKVPSEIYCHHTVKHMNIVLKCTYKISDLTLNPNF